MKHTGLLYRVISLVIMAAILAIAWGMDQFLAYQGKLASATFNYAQYLGLIAASALILIALWFGLGWLALFKCGYSPPLWIAFLVVGLVCTLFLLLYIGPSLSWLPYWANIINTLGARSAMVRSTGMFIAVLGLLNLALRSRARMGE